jgi:hypothetical protein
MEMNFSCREGGEDDEDAVPTGEMMTRSNGGVTTHAEQEGKEA